MDYQILFKIDRSDVGKFVNAIVHCRYPVKYSAVKEIISAASFWKKLSAEFFRTFHRFGNRIVPVNGVVVARTEPYPQETSHIIARKFLQFNLFNRRYSNRYVFERLNVRVYLIFFVYGNNRTAVMEIYRAVLSDKMHERIMARIDRGFRRYP